jgi:predicted amidohydrolase
VQTPEITTLMETDRARLFGAVRPEEGNAAVAYFGALARDLGIWLHLGSMGVLVGNGRIANRSLLFSPTGRLEARFDKIHMFDVQLPGGEVYRESKNYQPGDAAVLAELPWGTLGLTVCYDLRFPHLYGRSPRRGRTSWRSHPRLPGRRAPPTGTC